jgi:DNA-binding NarL/FixJ family response regulator
VTARERSAGPRAEIPPQTVLVVEPAAGLRDRLVALLGEVRGVHVAGEASSAEEALERLRREPFDAVLLDVDPAGGAGLRALGDIRRAARGVSLVVLSDDGEPELRERCLEQGADAFLITSMEFDRIGETLLALGRRRADRARSA